MRCLLFAILFSIICSTAFANEVTAFSYTIDCNEFDLVKKLSLKYSLETDLVEDISDLEIFNFFINSDRRMTWYDGGFTIKKNKATYIDKWKGQKGKSYWKESYTVKKGKLLLKFQCKNALVYSETISNWFINTPETPKPQIDEMNAKIYVESIFGKEEFLAAFPVKYSRKKDIVKVKKIKIK